MNALALLENLKQQGITVEVDGSEIHCRGSAGPLTPELIESLKQHKQELVTFLNGADPDLYLEMQLAGIIPKWRRYLLERVEILIRHEDYSRESAVDEVRKMIPYYENLN